MKLKAILISILSVGLISHSSLGQSRSLDLIKADKVINVVTTAASPPHGFKNPASNAMEGIMVEIAYAVAKNMGVSVNLTDVPFSGLIPTLTSGRADLMSAPLFVTEERSKVVDFSSPIYEWGEGIVVGDKAKRKYSNLEELKGERVGVLVDSVQFNMIKDMPGTKVSTYQDYPTLLADVKAGRIDLGVVDPPSIIYQIQSKNIPGVRIDSTYQPKKKWQIAIAVEKGNKSLLDAVNVSLDVIRKNGQLDMIAKKWGVSDLVTK